LIKEKKIKRDKNESVIYKGDDNSYYEKFTDGTVKCIDDEIPFEIPKSWRWSRLGIIASLTMGKTPPRGEAKYWNPAKYNWVSISDMSDYGVVSDTKERISEQASESCFRNRISTKESLLMSFKLTVGRTSILGIDSYHNEAIVTICPLYDMNFSLRNYLFWSLPILSDFGESKGAIKGRTLNSKSLAAILVPIPNKQEQISIIDKVNELLHLIK
jgi:type I restriction enzyme S subunit